MKEGVRANKTIQGNMSGSWAPLPSSPLSWELEMGGDRVGWRWRKSEWWDVGKEERELATRWAVTSGLALRDQTCP